MSELSEITATPVTDVKRRISRGRRPAARMTSALVLVGALVGAGAGYAASRPPSARAAGGQDLYVAGFATPESVLYDRQSDVYLVSNINGTPLDKDDNGFISRVSPEGVIVDLKWIDGADADITLHAPKGMAIVGDRLYVADIDTIRVFDRNSGESLVAIPVEGATFLNDVAADAQGPLGAVYVTDSGLDSGFSPTGTDAVYRLHRGRLTALAASPSLAAPNGLATSATGVYLAPFGSNVISRIDKRTRAIEPVASTPAGSLDGLVRLADGTLYVSSWAGSAVYKIARDGSLEVEVADAPAPADIGLDPTRDRLLIPLFLDNKIQIHPIH